jgi:transposase-like protein
MGRKNRKFDEVFKAAVVDDYVSGRKSAAQIAAEFDIAPTQVYAWKVRSEEKAKGVRSDELEGSGRSREDIKFILELEAERDAYQKTVGEQTLIIELLKKRLQSTNSRQRSELTGLIETLELAVQKRKHGK